MVNSRTKGKTYENDVRKRLDLALGMKFKRVLDQWAEAGFADVICEDDAFPFVIECKRYRTTSAFANPKWWEQVCVSATKAGKLPALVYKADRLEERWRVPVACLVGLSGFQPALDIAEQYDWRYACEMTFDEFCMIAREMMSDV